MHENSHARQRLLEIAGQVVDAPARCDSPADESAYAIPIAIAGPSMDLQVPSTAKQLGRGWRSATSAAKQIPREV